jgi:hypothetical protein
MLGGLTACTVDPEIGVPVALTGAALKLTSLELFDAGGGLIVDRYQNLYLSLQVEVSFPRIPTDISLAAGYGELIDNRGRFVAPTEAELVENLEGPSLQFNTLFGIWGVSWSPGAKVPAAKEHGVTNSFTGGSFDWTLRLPLKWPLEGFPPFAWPSGFLPFPELWNVE